MRAVEVLSDATNFVVVRTDGRKHPGLVVQGDRLREWLRLAQVGNTEAIESLREELAASVAEYERVCGTV